MQARAKPAPALPQLDNRAGRAVSPDRASGLKISPGLCELSSSIARMRFVDSRYLFRWSAAASRWAGVSVIPAIHSASATISGVTGWSPTLAASAR